MELRQFQSGLPQLLSYDTLLKEKKEAYEAASTLLYPGCHEQTSGIEHVNVALAQIEGTTQQNASLVEQAAAASEALQEQASRLMQEVNVFMLTERQTGVYQC